MIGDDIDATWNELEASRRQSEARLFAWDEMRGRYHGPYWDKNAKHGGLEPENPAYEIIATMKAQFLAGDPMCTAKAMRVDRPETRLKAIALRHTLNRLSRDADHKTFFGTQFPDWCFAFDVVGVQRTPAPWSDRGPIDGPLMRPRLFRISPKRYRYDPRATERNEERWRGYEQIASLKAILKQAKVEKGWHLDALRKLQPDAGSFMEQLPEEGRNLKRDDVKLYVVWCPEERVKFGPDKGFHGAIRMYAETGRQSGQDKGPLSLVYGPVDYYGPRKGPFYMSGQEVVPDSCHPLAVMQALENLARSLRLQSTVIDNAMRTYARFYIDGSGQQNAAQMIKQAAHNGVVAIKGWNKDKGGMFTKGGVDGDMLGTYQFLLERFDRRAGLSSTARGQAQSGTTATAEAIAQGGSAARMEGLRDTWVRHVRDCQRALAEILCMDEQFYMPLAPEAVAEMVQAGVPEKMIPQYVQGGYDGNESFEDYEIDIEPLSMRFQSQEEREMSAERDMLMWTNLSTVLSQPGAMVLNWAEIIGDYGDKMNQPELRERVNYPLAEQIASVMLMGAIQPGQGGFQTGSEAPRQPQTAPKQRTIDVSAISAQPSAKPQIGGGQSQAGSPTGPKRPAMAGRSTGSKAGGKTKRAASRGNVGGGFN